VLLINGAKDHIGFRRSWRLGRDGELVLTPWGEQTDTTNRSHECLRCHMLLSLKRLKFWPEPAIFMVHGVQQYVILTFISVECHEQPFPRC